MLLISLIDSHGKASDANIVNFVVKNSSANFNYRLGPVNSNTVNWKFHLIQIYAKIFAT